MNHDSQQQPATTAPLDAAKEIVATLNGLDKSAQALAIRFASETLGIEAPDKESTHPQAPTTQNAPGTMLGTGGASRTTDIRQFTNEKKPKSENQFAAVVAYFYRFEAPEAERRETIDKDVLSSAARGVRRQSPRWDQVLINAKNAGFFDRVEQGKYKLTAIGENLVAMTLPGNGSPAAPNTANAKQKPRGKNAKNKPKKSAKRGG